MSDLNDILNQIEAGTCPPEVESLYRQTVTDFLMPYLPTAKEIEADSRLVDQQFVVRGLRSVMPHPGLFITIYTAEPDQDATVPPAQVVDWFLDLLAECQRAEAGVVESPPIKTEAQLAGLRVDWSSLSTACDVLEAFGCPSLSQARVFIHDLWIVISGFPVMIAIGRQRQGGVG